MRGVLYTLLLTEIEKRQKSPKRATYLLDSRNTYKTKLVKLIMNFEDTIQSIQGSVTNIRSFEVKISKKDNLQIQKRVAEAVVRHILKEDSRFQTYRESKAPENSPFEFQYCKASDRVEVRVPEEGNRKIYVFGLVGMLNDNHNIPFFGEVFAGNLERAHIGVRDGFDILNEHYQRLDCQGVIFGNFARYNSRKFLQRARQEAREAKKNGITLDPVEINQSIFDNLPRKVKKLKEEYGNRIHFVEIGKFMKHAGRLYKELFEYANEGKLYTD